MALKHRGIVWTAALACALLAVTANGMVAFLTGFDLAAVLLVVIVPAGLMALGVVAAGGFVLAATWTRLRVQPVDLAFLMLLCASMVFLVYGCEYLAFQHPDGQTFSHFVALRITGARYLMHARGMPAGPPALIGDFGWVLLLVKTGCMLALARFGYSMVNRSEGHFAV